MSHATSIPKIRELPLLAAFVLLLGTLACQAPTGPNPTPDPSNDSPASGQNTVFIWLGADKDAYVSCGSGGGCPEREQNYSRQGYVVVARNAVALKKGYVHFGLPLLPAGSTIDRAYFELFHPASREDGQTDDLAIPFGRAASAWDARTLTLANEPNTSLSGEIETIKLRSQAWSGSGDIAALVREWAANPTTNHGFHIYWDRTSPGIEKGFYSNNDVRRKVDDLGLSPRLLLKVTLPRGSTVDDIRLPPLPADNDLPFDGQTVLMARTSVGTTWPATWDVTVSN